ncbi:MAG: tetraacyldisaccharide 4'-kinase [Bdellovibrionota bacterium]
MISRARSWLYEKSLLKVTQLPAFVVSVGNISMGGTGKSPFVMLLAERAIAAGLRTAVLSRGYKRKSNELVIVGAGEKLPNSDKIGDEPWMIKNRVPGISLLVHADRGRMAAKNWSALGSPELVILDDGFQHWKLARDRDVVMVDATESLYGATIPLGRLREQGDALGRADAIIVTRSGALDSREQSALMGQLSATAEKRVSAPWKKSGLAKPAITLADYQFSGFTDLNSGNKVKSVEGKEFVLVTGIAKPERFRALALSLGLKIAEEIQFPDHHPLDATDRKKIFAAQARLGGGSLLMSEKDAARWRRTLLGAPGIVLNVQFQFSGGEKDLDHFFANIFSEAKRCSISG